MNPTATCRVCGAYVEWSWEEAFQKFGFGDGDGNVFTADVAAVLRAAGYGVEHHVWGCHNDVILAITQGGTNLIPPDAKVGYDSPRRYLPAAIVTLLDSKLPSTASAKRKRRAVK